MSPTGTTVNVAGVAAMTVGVLIGVVACSTRPPAPSMTATAETGRTDASAAPSATASEADPSAVGRWRVLEEAPVARLEMATAVHQARIWLAGGISPLGEALTDVEVFDPAAGEWSAGPSLPAGLHHGTLVSDGGRLLLVGGYLGRDPSRPTSLVLVLDEGAGTWSEGPELPAARGAGAAAFDGSRIVFAGGVGPNGDASADVFALDGDAWSRIGTMARAREHLAAASDGAGRVWLLGGRVTGVDSNLADVEVVTGSALEQLDALPSARSGGAAFHAPGLGACLTGGEGPDQAFTTVECIDADGNVSTLPELNEAHHGHGAAVVDGVAYVLLGGPEPRLSAGKVVESFVLEP